VLQAWTEATSSTDAATRDAVTMWNYNAKEVTVIAQVGPVKYRNFDGRCRVS